jgi:NAD(P)-dependent dehydrogenase (short-subunit alcohol dehydrogenase family)
LGNCKYSFEHKVVLVTGGGSGIGQECAIEFAEAGATVVVADLNLSHAERVANSIVGSGGQAIALDVDVSDEGSVVAMAQQVKQRFGHLDYAVNSAGTILRACLLEDADLAGFTKVMAVNYFGTMLCMREELRLMTEGGPHAIVNIASTAGLKGAASYSSYSASKHAVIGLTKSAALEVAHRQIRVNAVCPNYTKTPLYDWHLEVSTDGSITDEMVASSVPLGRLGKPSDMAGLSLWLCSDASDYVTGQAISSCGGEMAGIAAALPRPS